MVALAQLPPELFAAPDQEEMLRHLARPAEAEPIPLDAQWQADVVAVPVAVAGAVRCVILPRADAVGFVEHEREIIRRGGAVVQAAERERCKRDRLWFIARWVDIATKFPIGKKRSVPFVPFSYQVRGIRLYDRAREEGRGIFQDKSRQLGESWLYMALFLHDVLYEDGFSALVTHRMEREVDDGGMGSTVKSLLGRLRFMYERLPRWIAPELEIKKLLVRNPESGSYIAGEAATPNIGRGSTVKVWLGDEWAHTEQSESAWASADEAVECPILNSTPLGEHNHFGRMHRALSSPASDGDFEVRKRFLVNRAHWSEHPLYSLGIERDAKGRLTSPWYRKAIATKTAEKAAQEYDVNYAVSLPGRYYPEFVHGVHVSDDVPLRSGWFYYLSADHGLSDTEVWGLWQTDGRTAAELVDEWHTVPPGQTTGADLTSREVASGILSWLSRWGLTLRHLEGVLPDPAGAQRDQTSGQSHHDLILDQWAREGQLLPSGRWIPANNAIAEGIESTRLLLKGTWNGKPFCVRFAQRCTLTTDSLQNYRRRATRDGRVLDEELKDWTNHAADMTRYFCHTLFPAIGDVVAEQTQPQAYASVSTRRSRGYR